MLESEWDDLVSGLSKFFGEPDYTEPFDESLGNAMASWENRLSGDWKDRDLTLVLKDNILSTEVTG